MHDSAEYRQGEGIEPFLLDVTRLVALRWAGGRATGIDRVSLAYLQRYGSSARAVVQHRGVIRVLATQASRRLFQLLACSPGDGTRARMAALLGAALVNAGRPPSGSIYLNVGHTDFDLQDHAHWVARHRLRAIYLVHDLIPITHPQHCRPHAVARHAGRVLGAIRHGSGIIVGSSAVEHDLRLFTHRLRLETPPVLVAPLAGATLSRSAQPAKRSNGYFLCVGTIESRKNHALLIEVWRRLRLRLGAATPQLVLVGRWGTGVTALRRTLEASAMLGGLVEVVEGCGDHELASLMLGGRAMLMPTLAEGFGLPMAEALTLGVPVIASDISCFHEVGQGIPRLLGPQDTEGWTTRIAALDDAAARRQRRIDAMRAYEPPTWDAHFGRVDAWLGQFATRPTPASVDRRLLKADASVWSADTIAELRGRA